MASAALERCVQFSSEPPVIQGGRAVAVILDHIEFSLEQLFDCPRNGEASEELAQIRGSVKRLKDNLSGDENNGASRSSGSGGEKASDQGGDGGDDRGAAPFSIRAAAAYARAPSAEGDRAKKKEHAAAAADDADGNQRHAAARDGEPEASSSLKAGGLRAASLVVKTGLRSKLMRGATQGSCGALTMATALDESSEAMALLFEARCRDIYASLDRDGDERVHLAELKIGTKGLGVPIEEVWSSASS